MLTQCEQQELEFKEQTLVVVPPDDDVGLLPPHDDDAVLLWQVPHDVGSNLSIRVHRHDDDDLIPNLKDDDPRVDVEQVLSVSDGDHANASHGQYAVSAMSDKILRSIVLLAVL